MRGLVFGLLGVAMLAGCLNSPNQGAPVASPDSGFDVKQAVSQVREAGEIFFVPPSGRSCPESHELSEFRPEKIQSTGVFLVSRDANQVSPQLEELPAGTEVCRQIFRDPLQGRQIGDNIPGRLFVEVPDLAGAECLDVLAAALGVYSWRPLVSSEDLCAALVGYLTEEDIQRISENPSLLVQPDFVAGVSSQGASGLISATEDVSERTQMTTDVPLRFHLDVLDANWDLDSIRSGSPLQTRDGSYAYPATVYSESSSLHLIESESARVRVFVLDTGLDETHPEFQRAMSSSSRSLRIGVGTSFAFDPKGRANIPDTGDCQGHGTAMSSLIGGFSQGVARNIEIIPVRVTYDCEGRSYAGNVFGFGVPYSAMVEALNWVLSEVEKTPNKPTVVNLSIAVAINDLSDRNDGKGRKPLLGIVERLIQHGVILVNSAGNEAHNVCVNDPLKLASRQQVITVGNLWPVQPSFDASLYEAWRTQRAKGNKGRSAEQEAFVAGWEPQHPAPTLIPAPDSNFGPCIDVWAPGRVWTAVSKDTREPPKPEDVVQGLSVAGGTSQAAAVVSGVAALWLQVNLARGTLTRDREDLARFRQSLRKAGPDMRDLWPLTVRNHDEMMPWRSSLGTRRDLFNGRLDDNIGPVLNLRGLFDWGDPCDSSYTCGEQLNVDMLGDGTYNRVGINFSSESGEARWETDSFGDGYLLVDGAVRLTFSMVTDNGLRSDLEFVTPQNEFTTVRLYAASVNGNPGDEVVLGVGSGHMTDLHVITFRDGMLRYENPLAPDSAELQLGSFSFQEGDSLIFSSPSDRKGFPPVLYQCRASISIDEEDMSSTIERLEIYRLSEWKNGRWKPEEKLLFTYSDPADWTLPDGSSLAYDCVSPLGTFRAPNLRRLVLTQPAVG